MELTGVSLWWLVPALFIMQTPLKQILSCPMFTFHKSQLFPKGFKIIIVSNYALS